MVAAQDLELELGLALVVQPSQLPSSCLHTHKAHTHTLSRECPSLAAHGSGRPHLR